jgi:hypothetical protein
MKDFLQGRTTALPTRPSVSFSNPPSNLPPIPGHSDQSVSTGEMNIENPDDLPAERAETCAEPSVEMVPDSEGRIGHIVVTCRCGEQITLQCNY